MAKLIQPQIIVTEIPRGKGTDEDFFRTVQQWYAPDGTLLCEFDPFAGVTKLNCEELRDYFRYAESKVEQFEI